MTLRDGFPRFSARSVHCGDAGHREACATLPENLGKPPFGSRMRPVGGRRNGLTMPHIASAVPPTRRAAYAISMGHYQRSLVLFGNSLCVRLFHYRSYAGVHRLTFYDRAMIGLNPCSYTNLSIESGIAPAEPSVGADRQTSPHQPV